MAHSDGEWMDAAARLSQRGLMSSRPNPSVGTIIVSGEGRVLARGWTQPGGRPHAEAHALDQLDGEDFSEATIYVSLEPCAHRSQRGPACAELLVQARPKRVVIGMLDPDPRTAGEGAQSLKEAGIAVEVLNHEGAKSSLAGYLTQQEKGRPFITLKLAMSLDGCLAMADGTSRWITGEAARAHVHSQRALHDGILVGGGTWRADKPKLDVRLAGLEDRSPQRILLTRGVPPDGVKVINAPEQVARFEDLHAIYVEGGTGVASSFLAADLVDRLDIYRAPIIIGDGIRAMEGIGLEALEDAHGRWVMTQSRQLGSDHYSAYHRTS